MLRHLTVATLVTASIAVIAPSSPVHAVTRSVTNGTELRAAFSEANSNPSIDRIVINASSVTIGGCNVPPFGVDPDNANVSGDLDFTGDQDLTVVGNSAARTVIVQSCDGDRTIDHRGSGTLRLEHLNVSDNDLADVPIGTGALTSDFSGAGVRAAVGTLELVDMLFSDNAASDAADAVAGFGNAQVAGDGGAVFSAGPVIVIDSEFTNNRAGNGGDGNDNGDVPSGGGSGGAISTRFSSLTISGSEFVANHAGNGGGGNDQTGGFGGSGGAIRGDEVTATDSIFRSNRAGAGGSSVTSGGGLGGAGGSISAAELTLSRVDVSSSSAGAGGGTFSAVGGRGGNGGGVTAFSADITGSEFDNNRAGAAGVGGFGTGGAGGDGGGLHITSRLDLDDSYVHDNRSGRGGDGTTGGVGGNGGGAAIVSPAATATVTATVFDDNVTGDGGVGSLFGGRQAAGHGGGVYGESNFNRAFDATNTTFMFNEVGDGDGARGAAVAADNVTLTFVTMTNNGGPAALDFTGNGLGGFDFVTASVIGDNAGANCADPFVTQSGGYNVEQGDSCGFGAPTDLTNSPTGLGAIVGGPDGDVQPNSDGIGRGPELGSALFSHIPVSACASGFNIGPVSNDQWGTARPSGDGCEPGAIEIGGIRNPPPDPDDPIIIIGPPTTPPGSPGSGGASKFVPLPPQRLFDTRESEAAPGPKGKVAPDSSIDVQITGVAGIPSDAVAVVMNVAAINSTGAGFVTTWPTGADRPLAATHNLVAAGQTRPNLVTVPIGAGGKVSIYTQGGAHFAGDVAGYYVEVGLGSDDGRIVTVDPQRLFDTRESQPAPGPKGKVGAGATIDVQVTGVAGIPSSGVAAVVMNLAGIQATGPGFVTAFPDGAAQPLAAVLNLTEPGATNSNLVMLPVSTDGKISLFTSGGVHLSGDVTGYVTADGGPLRFDGLFVPLTPTRVFDTRPGSEGAGPKGFIDAGDTIQALVDAAVGIPDDASGAILNVAGVRATNRGFVTGYPTGTDRPLSATLNLGGPDDTRPNAAILPIGTGDQISFFSEAGTHLVVDTTGYLTG